MVTEEVVKDREQRLRQWIVDNPQYEPFAGVIVMGYNSPMVPDADRFFEVQIKIRNRRLP